MDPANIKFPEKAFEIPTLFFTPNIIGKSGLI